MNYVACGLLKFIKMTDEECFAKLPSSIHKYASNIIGYYEESTGEVYITLIRNEPDLSELVTTHKLVALSSLNQEDIKSDSVYLDNTFNSLTDEDCMSVLSSKNILVYRKDISGELFIRLVDNTSHELSPMFNPKTGNFLTYEEWKKEFH